MRALPAADQVVGHDVSKLMAKGFLEARKIAPQSARKRYGSGREVGSGPAPRQACGKSRRDRLAQVRARPEYRVSRNRLVQSEAEWRVGMLADG